MKLRSKLLSAMIAGALSVTSISWSVPELAGFISVSATAK